MRFPQFGGQLRVEAPRPWASVVLSGAGPGAVRRADEGMGDGGGDEPPPPPGNGDEYLTRLVKLVPSEVIALYLTFKESASAFLDVWAAICLALVILVRTAGTRQQGKSIQWATVVISCISYILWIYATGGHLPNLVLPPNYPGIISVSIGVWTFVIPYVYKGD